MASNCERCQKFAGYEGEAKLWCEIDEALLVASVGDGEVSIGIARRMGALDNQGKYVWKCPEVVWTEEWKAEYAQRQAEKLTPRLPGLDE